MVKFSKKISSKYKLRFFRISIEELIEIQKLASEIWPYTFKNILTPSQITYMLNWMYSLSQLQEDYQNGDLFYLLKVETQYSGYVHLQLKDDNKIKIQKIYLKKEFQGKHLGKFMIDEIFKITKKMNCTHIELQVNRENKAVEFYKKCGFTIEYSEDFYIGEGFYMNDYIMSIQIP